MKVATRTCTVCRQGGEVDVDPVGLAAWQAGAQLIQDALPASTPGEREQLKTGLHPACFDRLVGVA